MGICLIVDGGMLFLLVERNFLTVTGFVLYPPLPILFIAAGVYLFIQGLVIVESYRLMIHNQAYREQLHMKVGRRIKRKLKDFES